MTIIDIFLLCGGIGLFLFGMHIMGDGLRECAGSNLKTILEHATSNRVIGTAVGCGMTMLIQSSSATTVMTIDFVSAELMTLAGAFSVVLGANMGTTITAEIVAFNIGSYAPVLIFIGMIMVIFIKNKLVNDIGNIIMGFGMLFFGIATMKDGIAPLKESAAFTSMLLSLNQPIPAVLIGIVFTAIVQSSSSSVGIFQTFAMQGLIPYEMAVYLVIGSSLGACMPAFLAMLAANRKGKRVSICDMIFNACRVIFCTLLVTLIPGILTVIKSLSPNDVMRQIANTHVFLAVISVLLCLPFTQFIVALAYKIIPHDTRESRPDEKKLMYINPGLHLPSALAVAQGRHEVVRMCQIAIRNLRLSMEAFNEVDAEKAQEVLETENTLDYLNSAITHALNTLRTDSLSKDEQQELGMMMLVVSNVERIGDHAEKMAKYANMRVDKYVNFSDQALKELQELGDATVEAVDYSLQVYADNRVADLGECERLEEVVDDQRDACENAHVRRLMGNQCEPITGMVYVDMISDLERCSDHALNVAYAIQGPKPVW